ncbi:MAG: IS630 family transposase [Chloroflexi bacterium]|nr:IS630 family transposase [Chloroflexota bacterium]
MLKELDWTPQQPIERASQCDEAAIALWRTDIWPELQRQAHLEQRSLLFVDESGFYLLPTVVRTYAPRGQTPILRVHKTRDHLSAMSAITPAGDLISWVRSVALRATDSIRFLAHLYRQLQRKLLVIWDGSPIHRAQPLKTYLADGAAHYIHLERLPAYAPELNPDEAVWRHLKHVELRNLCCTNLAHLHQQLDLAITRLRRRPQLIQSFFVGAQLPIRQV